MNKKIFKYVLIPNDKIKLDLPKGAEILTVQMQYNKPCLWALVDPAKEKEERIFRMVGTGHPIVFDTGSDYKYINTFQMLNGDLIFHLFEMIET